MSIKLMTQVWGMRLADSELLVLLALADAANDEGFCWPGIASLCRKTNKSERTVQRSIRELEGLGHLTRKEIVGKGCTYTIHPRQDDTPVTVTPPSPRRDTPVTVTPKPSKNHNTSRAKALSGSRDRGSTIEAALKDRAITADEATTWAVTELRWPRGEAKTEWQRFLDSNAAHGRRYKDWKAAWRNWCRSPFCEAAKRNDDKTSYRREPLRG